MKNQWGYFWKYPFFKNCGWSSQRKPPIYIHWFPLKHDTNLNDLGWSSIICCSSGSSDAQFLNQRAVRHIFDHWVWHRRWNNRARMVDSITLRITVVEPAFWENSVGYTSPYKVSPFRPGDRQSAKPSRQVLSWWQPGFGLHWCGSQVVERAPGDPLIWRVQGAGLSSARAKQTDAIRKTAWIWIEFATTEQQVRKLLNNDKW